METKDDSLESSTISALLSYSPTARNSNIKALLPKFSSPLKTNFESRNLWLRFGLTLSLARDSPRSALQAFNECLRIDQHDPLPAMLAAKLVLEDLDDPHNGLELATKAIERCQKLASPSLSLPTAAVEEEEKQENGIATETSSSTETTLLVNGSLTNTNSNSSGSSSSDNNNSTNHNKNHSNDQSTIAFQAQTNNNYNNNNNIDNNNTITPSNATTVAINSSNNSTKTPSEESSHSYLEAKCRYKNITHLLSRCYLLASIMHAHIYEREPESIKKFKTHSLKASLQFLDLATEAYSNDYLIYFHRALHEARQRSFSSAIDNLRHAIKLNPHHVPSIQLLIISLSALKLHEEALTLCESTLHEFEDNLLLLYIKCNLEQCLVETKGYKTALNTAQYMLKCIRRKSMGLKEDQPAVETKQATNLFPEERRHRFEKEDSFSGELSVWLLVAEIFIRIGSINDAELCVDEGSTHAKGALSYQVMFIRGLIAKAKSNLFEAKSFFQSCLALCPRHANALQQIAHVHYLLGNLSTAEKFLKDSLDVDGDCYRTWHYLSLVFIETNQHDKASECEKKAAVLEETSPVISISAISRLVLE